MSVVRGYAIRVFMVAGAIVAVAAATGPLWAWGRPDRAFGFALGAAASLARFAWSVRLAGKLSEAGPRRYAAERVMSLCVLGAALVAAGVVEGIDLPAAAVGVFVASAAAVVAAVIETRPAPGAGCIQPDSAAGDRG